MSIVTAPLRHWTIEAWHAEFGHREGRHELVRGRNVMSPTEANRNLMAAWRLGRLLDPALPPEWIVLACTSIQLRGGPEPTIRQPDLTIIRADIDPTAWLNDPTDVALVIEFVSPGSVETDWIAKRADYAAAGIPAYLIVDVTAPTPYVVLFDTLTLTPTEPAYADPTTDGTTATLRIDTTTITLSATDLT